ncbi:hypothetical protein HY971_00125 [Candidatus Kaiserbacteria bacterium]|nr:hypothetical protein [Candidatus Kaiserbacteria bacterium]
MSGLRSVNGPTVTVGVIGNSVTLDLAQAPDGSLPRCEGEDLLEGAPFRILNGPRQIIGRGDWQGALLQVSTFRLDFSEDLSRQYKVRDSWPGAQSIGDPFVQVRKRSFADQHQLVAIEDGAFVIVADRAARYIRIDCHECQLTAGPVEKVDFGRLLVARAELLSHSLKVLTWTWYTLRDLELGYLWTDTLQQRMTALKELGREKFR